MGTKRPHSAGESSGSHHENPARKRLRMNRPQKPKPQAVDLDSMNAIKKRARAIERLLARDNLKLPANKKNDLERELAAHKQRIEDARTKKDRSKMIAKYHMVRFFERKKAMRFVKQLEKKLSQTTDPEEVAQLKADLHVAQVDIDYAKYFPFMEPYISLYAAATSKEKDDDKNAAALYLRTPRPAMWTVIEETRKEGQAALERLQNRRPETSPSPEAAQQPEKKDTPSQQPSDRKAKKRGPRQERRAAERAAKSAREGQAEGANGDGDESDGFFE